MSEKLKILVSDDEKMMRTLLSHSVDKLGFAAITVSDGQECIDALCEHTDIGAVLLDFEMPKKNGLEVLNFVKKNYSTIPVIMVTAMEDVQTAVQAIKIGAYDYLVKPVDPNRLETTLQNALKLRKLKQQVGTLEFKLRKNELFTDIIGESKRLKEVFELIDQVLATDVNVLIIGESGTGKELLAKVIHEGSRRAEGPFVAVNCAAINLEIADSLLFGHKKGAFTGATEDRGGYFEQADTGTVFMDEIGDMPLDIQAKVLRVLEERAVRRVGERKERMLDFRVIAATNNDLALAVQEGTFRTDLYFRLEEYPVYLPPLRERKEDIPILAQHFMDEFCHNNQLEQKTISDSAMTKLMAHSWPGNIRELRNVIRRAAIRSRSSEIEEITISELDAGIRPEEAKTVGRGFRPAEHNEPGLTDDILSLYIIEREAIQKAYKSANHNTAEAAKILGISRATLYRKLKKLGIEE